MLHRRTVTATAMAVVLFPLHASAAPVDPPLRASIMEIQGDGPRSLIAGARVETIGVVTLVAGNGQDFWIQDETGDGDPATSDTAILQDLGDRVDALAGTTYVAI